MGHVRIGFLPHTKQWNAIVEQLGSYDDNDISTIAVIADSTIEAVRKEYQNLQHDESLIKAILYLANIVVSSRKENQAIFLQEIGYSIDADISLFTLTTCAHNLIQTAEGSLEVNKLVRDSVAEAVIEFYEKHSDNQINFFQTESNPFKNKGSGKEFCELARYFFASFTEKEILYYVDREASNVINDYNKYLEFSDTLKKHTSSIVEHAFEISEIMQSFAAGWFNKYALDKTPSEDNVTDFLKMSFGKIREELRLEAKKNE